MSEAINTPEETVPANLKSVLDWCEKFRPDLRPVIWAERNNNAFILLMTVGFEAGRRFQKDNPDWPLDATHLYLEKTAAAEGKKVEDQV